jgi:hypothetical protein
MDHAAIVQALERLANFRIGEKQEWCEGGHAGQVEVRPVIGF